MSTAEIEVISTDSAMMLASKRLRLLGKTLETPRRALPLRANPQCEAKAIRNPNIRGMNEIYRVLTKTRLDNMYNNRDQEDVFTSSLNGDLKNGSGEADFSSVIFSYDSRDEFQKKHERWSKLPSERDVSYLFALLSTRRNDIIAPPLMPHLHPDEYQSFLKRFFEYRPSYRENEVMGIIPADLPRMEWDPIIKFYDEQGIRLFSLDLHGGTPDTHYVDMHYVLDSLFKIEKHSHEHCFLYGLNVGYGRPLDSTDAAPAKDILSFFSGFDSFGPSHVAGMRLRPDLYGKLPPEATAPRPKRLFNRSDYGYYRADIIGTTTFPKEKGVVYQIENFRSGVTDWDVMSKIFNAERLGLEAELLRGKLQETKSLLGYLKSKGLLRIKKNTSLLRDLVALKEELKSSQSHF